MSLHLLSKKHEQLVNKTSHWNATLPFVVSEPFLVSLKSPYLPGNEFKEQDLFQLVAPDVGGIPSLLKWYFCPKQYPPDGDFKSSKDSWPKLKNALLEACPSNGYSLVANGSHGSKRSDTKLLSCSRHRPSRLTLAHCHLPAAYRQDHVRSNKRAGSRGEAGRKMPCRNDSYKAPVASQCCKVRLCLGSDSQAFS
jgi:hypothetical protein